ncbi:acyltransferase family protein [Rhodocytophaga aerolata]|uniref:Acyltransferase family protein n=1 Tax=Rhodocytophaga aerolata TaxID=455078 RepID=A0ABT8RF60_9BACT|nr:acyltransferase family protein [Rhodocytophaga aerolata]MDO1449803.1 acyltransferase family protein [Rhodocytophaga aerolata]
MKKKIAGLDSLRFLLALWVLFSHFGGPPISDYVGSNNIISKTAVAFYNNAFVGVAAVIAFFIISGLVIHLPYRSGRKMNLLEFYSKRYIRIGIPMLLISVLAYYFNSFGELPFWSLYAELIYYTIYPIILWGMNKINIRIIIMVAFIISYILAISMSHDLLHFLNIAVDIQKKYEGNYWQLGVGLTWLLGLPCWLLGVLLAENLDNIAKAEISYKNVLFSRLIIIIISIFCSVARFHLHLSYILSLNIFSIVAYFWISKEIIYYNKHQPSKLFEWAGQWSYSIYICHSLIPIVFALMSIHQKNGFLFWFYEVSAALIFSYVFYLAIESPSHYLARKVNLTPKKVKI